MLTGTRVESVFRGCWESWKGERLAADWNWAMRPTEKKRITGLEWKLLSSDGEGKERQREASPKVESTCSFNLDMEIMKLSHPPSTRDAIISAALAATCRTRHPVSILLKARITLFRALLSYIKRNIPLDEPRYIQKVNARCEIIHMDPFVRCLLRKAFQ